MIGILDYGMGNLLSVQNGFQYVGLKAELCNDPDRLSRFDRLVMPGVGAFRDCIDALRDKGLVEPLNEFLRSGRPILGICLGLQVCANRSYEHGEYMGLGWIDADVVRLSPSESTLRVPQVGWNEVFFERDPLFEGIPEGTEFYFVHSYHMNVSPPERIAYTNHGQEVTAAVRRENLMAVQFHPEKSQEPGLKLLSNFGKI